jgi:hypothetical protein
MRESLASGDEFIRVSTPLLRQQLRIWYVAPNSVLSAKYGVFCKAAVAREGWGHNAGMAASPKTDKDPVSLDVPREFHRRMAAIIDAVQSGVWEAGVHNLLGYATDYAFGQQRGLQTLVLKSSNRSAYVRLNWDTVMGNTEADRHLVESAIKSAIRELT